MVVDDQFLLDVREVTNVSLTILTFTLCCLFGRQVWKAWATKGYAGLDKPTKAAIGIGLIMFGEFLRALVIWELLHYERTKLNYSTRATILILALACIVGGALCAIRVFSPSRVGHRLWLTVLGVAVAASALSMILHYGWH